METVDLYPIESLTTQQGDSTLPIWTASFTLFQDVKNMNEIRQKLLKGEIQAALINPCLITDIFQLTVAVNKAVISQLRKKMSTNTLFTEIIFNLSPVRKISQALQNFGVDVKQTDLLAVTVSQDSKEDDQANLLNLIDGRVSSLTNLSTLTNIDLIKKTYKLTEEEIKNGSVLNSVLGRMACKDFS